MAERLLKFIQMIKFRELLNKKDFKILFIILIFAAIIRIYNLSSVPPALTPDEAALGYNAYSILKTGRDEHGQLMPLIFKSFGDYKPGLYVYLSIPFVFLMGLNEFAVRLPSVIAGLVIIYLVYLIFKKLFFKSTSLPIVAAIVTAFNPYLIYFSRGAWEANVSLALTLIGINFFIDAFKNGRHLLFSAVFFSLSILTYQGAKMSTLTVLLLLFIAFIKEIKKIKLKFILWSFLIGLIITLPVLISLLSGQAERLTIFSIFSYPRPVSETETYKGALFGLFHSDNLNYMRMVMSRWFNFYSGQFLFFAGDLANPVHTPPYQGVLLLADLFMLPLGFFIAFKNRLRNGFLFFLLWLLTAPLSAAISRDQTNAVRSLPSSIPLIFYISYGLNYLLTDLKSRASFILKSAVLAFYLLSIIYLLDAYFVHLPKHNSDYWRYGYKQAVKSVTELQSDYSSIVFEQSFNQPYIYFLFYKKYDPEKWQKQAKLVNSEYVGDVGYQEKLDNIYFEKLDWSKLRFQKDTLVVSDPNHVPAEILKDGENYELLNDIKYMNGTDTAFLFIKIK
jgi:4-amino-4-deoxy-L-arabinose transferase-like glycosyltransferase